MPVVRLGWLAPARQLCVNDVPCGVLCVQVECVADRGVSVLVRGFSYDCECEGQEVWHTCNVMYVVQYVCVHVCVCVCVCVHACVCACVNAL